MTASFPTPRTAAAAEHPTRGRWLAGRSRLGLLLGGAALLGACLCGLEAPDERFVVLGLIGLSLALFAAAMWLSRKTPPVPDAAMAAAPMATPAPPPMPPLAPRTAPPTAVVRAESAAAPAPSFPSDRALPMVIAPATPAVASRPAAEPASPPPAVRAGPTPAPGPLDVTALMKAPLSDLLLAALCKDPEGARRIFAQAVLQGAAAPPAPPPAPSRQGMS